MDSQSSAFQWTWRGEANRALNVYRPCQCGCDYRDGVFGVGYLSASNAAGDGFTIWIRDERIFALLKAAFTRTRKKVRRATVSDQQALLEWLKQKFKM
jgi:hypothetical protein